eukprot:TRINITY_DN1700_c0_g1_i1.p1 TRINITY_DN1700_c0_g1~~TRINITY_DN1700_c0_g1_i1.p1  ORF type:complete len:88 (-),score=11.61 TRINITY_DN1700_c0_g1_i1:64-327(-)
MRPGGVRIGTPALTSRGMMEADFDKVSELLHQTCQLALTIQSSMAPELKKLKDWREALARDEWRPQIESLREKVVSFAADYFMPGVF